LLLLQLVKTLQVAKTSDASMSKFSVKVKDEDRKTKGLGKKRKVTLIDNKLATWSTFFFHFKLSLSQILPVLMMKRKDN
jgi:hypothetical protein